jgi:hypothetical protein
VQPVLCLPQAPEYYEEIQTHIQMQAAGEGAAGGKGGAGGAGSSSDFWWDVGGWVLLAGVITGVFFLARSSAGTAAAAGAIGAKP